MDSLQAAARAAGRTADPESRPDLDDGHALDLAKQIGAMVSFDLIAHRVTITHKASGTSVTESTAGDRGPAPCGEPWALAGIWSEWPGSIPTG